MIVDDETLSAYLDGELSPAERARVEAALAADPALRQRLAALEAATLSFAESIRAVDRAPAPAHVEALLRSQADNVVAFRPKPRAAAKWLAPAAAAAMLAAFVAIGWRFGPVPGATRDEFAVAMGPVGRGGALHRILESTPSAQTARIGAAQVSPVATFRIASGAPCREFLVSAAGGAARAVACRDDRQWTVKIAAEESPSTAGYQPASGPSLAISAYIDDAMEGDALGAAEERTLIAAKWRAVD
jgi:anti-sigma factor RsiW